MTPSQPRAAVGGLAVAMIFAALCLFFAIWNPMGALVPAIVFAVVAFGIAKRRRWSAYGGALFILALSAVAVVALARLGLSRWQWIDIAAGVALSMFAAWVLFRAGRSMPAVAAASSRWIWMALAVVVFLSPQLMHAYVISAGSMENTLLTGDRILVRPAVTPPARGQVVSFRYPVDPDQIFVKRVVAAGGDRLRIENKRLFVNGSAVDEPYAVHNSRSIDPFRDNFPSEPNVPLPSFWSQELQQNTVNGELVVPQGRFFVLGDNRDNSLDSRYWGFLEEKDFVGKPVFVYFSAAATPGQVLGGPFGGPPVLLHPSMIRWGRMFKGL
ncbi:MAG: signal peptidase I [Bryobacterales bacterium]|nr:signal peptidase I [Bryobacterales bacterium]